MLCRGYQKHASAHNDGADLDGVLGVPGIFSNTRNVHVDNLKQHAWNALPKLLGHPAENILSDMLLHYGVFQPVENSSNLVQLSGVPLCDVKTLKPTQLDLSNLQAELIETRPSNEKMRRNMSS